MILDDILNFSRLEAGGLKIEKILFCPRQVLGSIRDLLVRRAAEKQLEFRLAIDAGRLRQVLADLAGVMPRQAGDFCPAIAQQKTSEGRISVTC